MAGIDIGWGALAEVQARTSGRAGRYTDPAAYCAAIGTIDRPDRRYVGEKVPDWMARALMLATGAPADSQPRYFKRAAWRCDGGRVLACSYGANIPCDQKADTSRVPGRGEREYCRENPGANSVPAVATGHAAVYAWRCQNNRPVITRQVLKVDRRGFPAEFWHVVTPPASDRP